MTSILNQAYNFKNLSIQSSFKNALAQVNPTSVVVENPNNIPEQAKGFVYDLAKQINNFSSQLKSSNPNISNYLNRVMNYLESSLASHGTPGAAIKEQTQKFLNNLNYLTKNVKDDASLTAIKYLADETNQALNLMNSANFEKFYNKLEELPQPTNTIKEVEVKGRLPQKSVVDIAKQIMSKNMKKEDVSFSLAKLYQQYLLPLVDQYKKLMEQKTPENPVLDAKSEAKFEQLKSLFNGVKAVVGPDNFSFLTRGDGVLATFADKDYSKLTKLSSKFVFAVGTMINSKLKEIFDILNKLYSSGMKSPAMQTISINMGEIQDLFSESKNYQEFTEALKVAKNKLEGLKLFTGVGNPGAGQDNLMNKELSKKVNELYNLVVGEINTNNEFTKIDKGSNL